LHYILRCSVCSTIYNRPEKSLYRCKKCGNGLELVYNYERIASQINREILEKRKPGIWRYKELLPVKANSKIVSLGEGGTRLHNCRRLAKVLGIRKIYAKDETRNPTGTYKDRPAAVGISKALEFGVKTVALASDGNAGPAMAAYAAKRGLKCYVLMPANTPVERINQVQIFGGKVIRVKGTVSDCLDLLYEVQGHYRWYQLTTAILSNPYQAEGSKTIVYEICQDLEWRSPDWLVVPVGGGSLLTANWKGLKELSQLGFIERLPRMVGVQAEGCAPVVRAYEQGKIPRGIESWGEPKTIAITIAVPSPLDGVGVLEAIKESNGTAIAVSDEEILEAEKLLAETEGIFSEPAGVVSLAGVRKLIDIGKIDKEENIVFTVTGTGLKDSESVMRICKSSPCIEPRPEELRAIIKSS